MQEELPTSKSILWWYGHFEDTGNLTMHSCSMVSAVQEALEKKSSEIIAMGIM
jgi:hypothetical protein